VKIATGSVMTAVTAGKNRGFATDQYGQVWAWGADSAGELGLPTAATIAQPTKVAGLAHARNVSSSLDTSSTAVVDTDGVLWSLGNNGAGLWSSSVSGPANAPLRMPRPDGFTAPTWQ
jgi:alpha-tubulin suppressor-like RCC1 family protein